MRKDHHTIFGINGCAAILQSKKYKIIEIMIIVFTDDEYFRLICLDSFFLMVNSGINPRKNKEAKIGKTIHIEKKFSARPTGIIAIIIKYVIAIMNNGKKFF